jgi:hypothetical protein
LLAGQEHGRTIPLTEILSAPELKEVFKRVLKHGFEIVTLAGEMGLKAKGKSQ